MSRANVPLPQPGSQPNPQPSPQPSPQPIDLEQASATLVVKMRAGDQESGALLDRTYRAPLSRYVARYLAPGEVEDAVQDIFLSALASPTLPDDFRAWLYRIARNTCLNRKRSSGRRIDGQPLPSHADPSADQTGQLTRLLREEDRAHLERALDRLSLIQREAVELRYIEGLSRAEIATVIGESIAIVKSRIFEGISRLRG